MDIRSSMEGLQSILGTGASTSVTTRSTGNASNTASSGLSSDSATLSSAANEVSQSAGDNGVRMEKVSSIQSALAAGTYNVSPALVASKLVDSMLGSQA